MMTDPLGAGVDMKVLSVLFLSFIFLYIAGAIPNNKIPVNTTIIQPVSILFYPFFNFNENKKSSRKFIIDEEGAIPAQAMNSSTHGAYSYLSRSAENMPLSADVAQVEADVVAR